MKKLIYFGNVGKTHLLEGLFGIRTAFLQIGGFIDSCNVIRKILLLTSGFLRKDRMSVSEAY